MALLAALVFCAIYSPGISGSLSAVFLVTFIGGSIYFIFQKHNGLYKQGQITRLKFARNILFELLGLLLTICAASYLGGLAGTHASQYGLWTGLIVGIVVGFISAWGVRQVWSNIFGHITQGVP